jgi:hypothetical protein
MTERDAQIIELTKRGLSARNVRDRLGLSLSVRQVQRIAHRHVGAVVEGNSSATNFIPIAFMPIVKEALRRLGKDASTCEMCGATPRRGCIVHHKKYEGCTIYDLMYICSSCNNARVNKGLS